MGTNPTYEAIKRNVLSELTDEWQSTQEITRRVASRHGVSGIRAVSLALTNLTFHRMCEWRPTTPSMYRLSPEFRTESPVTVRERLGSGGIPTAPPIPRKTEGRINVKGAD